MNDARQEPTPIPLIIRFMPQPLEQCISNAGTGMSGHGVTVDNSSMAVIRLSRAFGVFVSVAVWQAPPTLNVQGTSGTTTTGVHGRRRHLGTNVAAKARMTGSRNLEAVLGDCGLNRRGKEEDDELKKPGSRRSGYRWRISNRDPARERFVRKALRLNREGQDFAAQGRELEAHIEDRIRRVAESRF
jgi:hypothetical protein